MVIHSESTPAGSWMVLATPKGECVRIAMDGLEVTVLAGGSVAVDLTPEQATTLYGLLGSALTRVWPR